MSLDRSADRKGSGHVGIVWQWPGRFWSLARGGDGGGGPGIATSGSAAERSRPRNGLCGDGRGGTGTWRGAVWCRGSQRSGSGADRGGPGRVGIVRRWRGRFWYFARSDVVPEITTVGLWRGPEREGPCRDRAAMGGAAAGATCEGSCSGVAPLFSPPSDIPSVTVRSDRSYPAFQGSRSSIRLIL